MSIVFVLAVGAFAPMAMASGSSDFGPPGTIPHEASGYPYAYASGAAHTYVDGIQSHSDHTVCPAMATGFGGLRYVGPGSGLGLEWSGSNCGYGYMSWFPAGSGTQKHGAVMNPNQATDSYVDWAWYQWSGS